MLGWHISVYRQRGDRFAPARLSDERGFRVGVWQTGLDGVDWIEEVARAKGYCTLAETDTRAVTRRKLATCCPLSWPDHQVRETPGTHDPGDILGPQWVGRNLIDHEVANACDPDEWLLIEAWDES